MICSIAFDADAELMLRVRIDDVTAFEELVARYESRIFGFLQRSLGDRQEAEDRVQEVFLRLYRSRGRYERRALFSTWIFRIARNVARNAIRSRRRRAWLNYVALEQTETRLPERFGDGPTFDPIEQAEATARVRGAMDRLMDRQRQALELQQDHDCSYPEIARRLDVTPKAAKSLLYRARVELRRILDEDVRA